MTAPIIAFRDVSKSFKGLVAVSEVSFDIGPGVTALLGPNGAGKSTVLRMLVGLTAPDRGTVSVFGHDPRSNTAVLRYVGLVPQQEGVFPRTRAIDFVRLAAVLNSVDDPDAAARMALEAVELDPDDTRFVDQYSKGMRQRVKLAQAIVHGPSVIVADEPLNGLDPRQRQRLIRIFQRLGAEGRCVIVSSHVLDEVERFGSQVLVLAQGRLAAVGDFRAIRDLMDDRPHLIRLRSDNPRALTSALLARGIVRGVQFTDADTAEVAVDDVALFRRSIAPAARHLDCSLTEVAPLDDDLESVFRYLVAGPGGR
ncbi:MAG: ABC transporter ATP-binding protein [Microthrixaceae bacterium]|nr:ABC transporter ATP-binding protein [Microthrixaceae bacterium]MCO5313585.1 ABC transporter ATP-binding protein [Microthrixaceae bacterium]